MAETRREAHRHESHDISIRPLVLFGLGLGALLIVCFLLVRGVLAMFTPQPSTTWRAAAPQLPPEPRLQVAPRQELISGVERSVLGWRLDSRRRVSHTADLPHLVGALRPHGRREPMGRQRLGVADTFSATHP